MSPSISIPDDVAAMLGSVMELNASFLLMDDQQARRSASALESGSVT